MANHYEIVELRTSRTIDDYFLNDFMQRYN